MADKRHGLIFRTTICLAGLRDRGRLGGTVPVWGRIMVACAMFWMLPSVGDGADPGRNVVHEVVAETLPKLVKIHGAGGFRGLESYGSGFLISDDGLIATAWGPLLDADPITAVLDDGRRFEAKLVAVDSMLGLALLKIDAEGVALPYFDLSTARPAEVGDRIFAFSNMFRVAAGDEPVSVMHGSILSHTTLEARRGRVNISFNEPIYLIDSVTNNPGAAGGAIVGLDGLLIGMIGRELRGVETETWINYAISSPVLAQRFAALRDGNLAAETPEEMDLEEMRRPVELGLVLIPNVTTRTPAYVTDVLADSASQRAGLRRDDLIVFTNGEPTRSIEEFVRQLSRMGKGDPVVIVVRRDGQLETLELEMPVD